MRVLVTYRHIPAKGLIDELRQAHETVVNPGDGYFDRSELKRHIADVDAVVCLPNEPIDAELLDAAPRLKVIANYAVGYNNIDVHHATTRGVMVTNTPGVVTDATADMAWALLMGLARHLRGADMFTRSGNWTVWRPEAFIASDITGATLGIVGFGRIGQAVAKRAACFDMRVLYHDVRRPGPDVEQRYRAEYVGLDTLLREADFVTLHVLLDRSTYHIINAERLSLMKPSAYLINASRGPVVDEPALVQALREKIIAGAGLDVYENEPQLTPGLAELDNVLLMPHLGANSNRTRDMMARITVNNIAAALAGKRPPNLVNPEVWQG
ncbi:MAG: 2-hydroxyacid dehydrogenase [Chloroflexota bacterium]